MAWPSHSTEFALNEVLRKFEEMRTEQKDQLDGIELRIDALKTEQGRMLARLSKRMEQLSSMNGDLMRKLDAGLGAGGLSEPRAEGDQASPPPTPEAKAQTETQIMPRKESGMAKKPRNHTKELDALRIEVGHEPTIHVPNPQAAPLETDPVKRIGKSVWFKMLSSFIVMVSIIIVALEANHTAAHVMATDLCIRGKGPAPDAVDLTPYRISEIAIMLWMVFELFINLKTTGALCSGPDWKWNVFDLGVLTVSVLQMLTSSIGELSDLPIGRIVKFIRVMRLAKVMRTLKVVRHLHGVRKMILSMVGSLSSLFWALFLMFMITFLVGVSMLQIIELYYNLKLDTVEVAETLAQGTCAEGGPDNGWNRLPPANEILPMFQVDPESDYHTEQVRKLYGSTELIMLTLFSSISGGSEWSSVADPVQRMYPVLFTIMWMTFISVMVFGMLNVLTGIFVDAAMQAAQSDRVAIIMKQREEREEAEHVLRHSFDMIDEDKSGILTREEFLVLLSDEEVCAVLMNIGLDTGDAGLLFSLLDDDSSGTIQFEEFLDGCLSLKGGAQKIDAMNITVMNRRMMKIMVTTMHMIDDMWTEMEERTEVLKTDPLFAPIYDSC